MIYTITMNPAIDYTMHFKNAIQPDEVDVADQVQMCAGGKGINCSILLNNIGIKSTVLGFLGGMSGQWIRSQLHQYPLIDDKSTGIEGDSRMNVKVHDTREFVLNAAGPMIHQEEMNDLLEKMDHLTSDDYVMVCGRLAEGIPVTFLYEIADRVNDAGAKLIMDTVDMRLEDMNYCRPWLIKPNVKELGDLIGKQVTLESVSSDVALVREKGAENILLTRGADGAWFQGKEGTMMAKSPKVEVVSTNGAGDSSLAAFTGKFMETGNLKEALIYSMSAGTAAVSFGIIPSKEQIDQYCGQVEIRKIQ